MGTGIAERAVDETPIAVVDFETTGLVPGVDRVVEVSVVRVEPGHPARRVLNSLVNPGRPVAATEVHGINDADVADAPDFRELIEDLLEAVSGCVLAAYNVYFDISFLQHELTRAGFAGMPPYVCLMELRPMLGLGDRCALHVACEQFDIAYTSSHVAAEITRVGSELLARYLEHMRRHKIVKFADLAVDRRFRFVESFVKSPIRWRPTGAASGPRRHKPRHIEHQALAHQTPSPAHLYWDALTAAVADLRITSAELGQLQYLRARLALPGEQVRMFHARVFAMALRNFIEDSRIDDQDQQKLQRLHQCLRQLGWAPGD
jgi:DNA polymerase III subunit epsilon